MFCGAASTCRMNFIWRMVTHGSKEEPWHIYLATTVVDPMVKIPFHFPFTQVFPCPPPYVFDSVLLVSLGWYCGTCELVTSRGRPRTQTGEERRGEERIKRGDYFGTLVPIPIHTARTAMAGVCKIQATNQALQCP